MSKIVMQVTVVLGMLILGFGAQATTLDLTTAGSSGFINGALFGQEDQHPSGTGLFGTFVEVGVGHNLDIIQAYNTTVNGVLNNGPSDVHNHALLLSDVAIANIGGTDYREFKLDINQNQNEPLESLDEIQIFLSGTPNQSVTTFTAGILDLADASPVYRLDAGGDNWIKLDASLSSGQGADDMFAYIPDSLFTGGGPYVYLYSRFGENFENNANFEEWGASAGEEPLIPEPASVILLGLGLGGLVLKKTRKAV